MKLLDWLAHEDGLAFAPQTRTPPQARTARPQSHTGANYALSFATTAGEIEEAQRLRFKVFAEEMGARLPDPQSGLDRDVFDACCEHLLVRDLDRGQVVGAYRLLPPESARRIGRFYSEAEFDLSRLALLRDKTVEAGRSCVHWEHRNGTVIMLLWSGIARFMRRYGYDYLIGCASVSLRDGGHAAANLYRSLGERQFVDQEYRVFPRLPLPVDKLANGDPVVAPPLVKGYLRAGAKVGGAPAWDPDFNTADLFVLLPIAQMNARYARHFS
jgi:putative hemolysin